MIEDYPEPATKELSEAQRIYCMISKYTEGRAGLDIGCGGWKIIGSIGIDIRPGVADIVGDISQGLNNVFIKKRGRPKKYDYIFSSHLLEDFDEEKQREILNDWTNYLKPGGHLILYVPERGKYKGCNVAHKHEFTPHELRKLMIDSGFTITDFLVESIVNPLTGYSILAVGKKNE